MIQRKQTIFLLLALCAVIVCLCLPIGRLEGNGLAGELSWYNLGVYSSGGLNAHPTLFIDLVVVGTLSFITIFLYKRRPLQLKLCAANIILCLVWYGVYIFAAVAGFASEGNFHINFAACLPLVAMVFLFLARRGVKADEELIKSMDRIR